MKRYDFFLFNLFLARVQNKPLDRSIPYLEQCFVTHVGTKRRKVFYEYVIDDDVTWPYDENSMWIIVNEPDVGFECRLRQFKGYPL